MVPPTRIVADLPVGRLVTERVHDVGGIVRRDGRPIEAFDAQIAATALVAGADLATRDVGDFAGCGLTLLNPWEAT